MDEELERRLSRVPTAEKMLMAITSEDSQESELALISHFGSVRAMFQRIVDEYDVPLVLDDIDTDYEHPGGLKFHNPQKVRDSEREVDGPISVEQRTMLQRVLSLFLDLSTGTFDDPTLMPILRDERSEARAILRKVLEFVWEDQIDSKRKSYMLDQLTGRVEMSESFRLALQDPNSEASKLKKRLEGLPQKIEQWETEGRQQFHERN